MKFIRFLLAFLLVITLNILVVTSALLQVVVSGTDINGLLAKSGVYTLIAEQTRSGLINSPRVPGKYQDAFAASLERTVTAEQIEAMVKPAVVDVASWINQPTDTPPPDVIILIKPAKDALIGDLSQSSDISQLELQGLQTQLSQQVPDQLRLSSLDDFVSGGTTSASTAESGDPSGSVMQTLQQIKSSITTIRLTQVISLVVTIVLTIGLCFLSWRAQHSIAGLTGFCFGLVGGIWLGLSLILPIVLPSPAGTLTQDTLMQYVLPVIVTRLAQASLIPSVILLLVGVAGMATKLFHHPSSAPGTISTSRPR